MVSFVPTLFGYFLGIPSLCLFEMFFLVTLYSDLSQHMVIESVQLVCNK